MHIFIYSPFTYTSTSHTTVLYPSVFPSEAHPGTQGCLGSLSPLKVALKRSVNWEHLGQSIQTETELPDYPSWCESREIWKSGIEREGKEKEEKNVHRAAQDVITSHILGHSSLIKIAE